MTVLHQLEAALHEVRVEKANYPVEDKPGQEWRMLHYIERDLDSVVRRLQKYKTKYQSGV